MPLDAHTLVILVFIIVAISAFQNGGNWSTDHFLIWGPALVLQIPLAIISSLVASMPILAPVLIILILAYFNMLGNVLGEPFLALVTVTAVIVMLGV